MAISAVWFNTLAFLDARESSRGHELAGRNRNSVTPVPLSIVFTARRDDFIGRIPNSPERQRGDGVHAKPSPSLTLRVIRRRRMRLTNGYRLRLAAMRNTLVTV